MVVKIAIVTLLTAHEEKKYGKAVTLDEINI